MKKECTGCHETKILTQFQRSPTAHDGHTSQCRACQRERVKASRRKRRLAVIELYGGKCACCEERRYEFLAIDHVENDGNIDRLVRGKGSVLSRADRGGPSDRYQVLCHNCNMSKEFYGECPHERDRHNVLREQKEAASTEPLDMHAIEAAELI